MSADGGRPTVEPEDLPDDPEYEVLVHKLTVAGWSVGHAAIGADGVTPRLRPWPYTMDVPGMPTRTVRGRDEREAIRNALAESRGRRARGAAAG